MVAALEVMVTGATVALNLPILQSDSEQLTMVQTRWASILQPLLTNPMLEGAVLKQVQLTSGSNVINHKLGRKLQGWIITRQRGPANVYDTQDANAMPQLTLQLESSASVSVDLYVF